MKSSLVRLCLILLLTGVISFAQFFNNSFTFEPLYSFYPDASNLYFLHNFKDPTLFTRDLFTKNYRQSFNFFNNEFIYVKIYSFLLQIFPLSLAVKIVSLVLCIITTLLIYKIGIKLYSSNFSLFFSGLFLVYFLSMDSFFGGQMRNFGILLVIIFLFFLVSEQKFVLPFLLPLSALFYSYLLPTFVIVCILFIVASKDNTLKTRQYILWLALNIVISLFFIIGIGGGGITHTCLSSLSIYGTRKYLLSVKTPINPGSLPQIILFFILNMNEHSRLYFYLTLFFLVFNLIIAFVRQRLTSKFKLPRPIGIMLLSSSISFLAIYPFHPFIASRQFIFIVPLFLVFLFSLNFYEIIKYKLRPHIFLAFIIICFLILHPLYNDVKDYKKYKPLYDYIENLPTGILVAGNPKSDLTRTIPFFSKRAIFLSDKLSFTDRFTYSEEESIKRRKQLIEALYADSWNPINEFISQYKIDYFVLEDIYYDPSFLNFLNNLVYPSDKILYNFLKEKMYQKNFLLLEFAKKNYDFKCYVNGHEVFILRSSKIINGKS